MIANTKLEIGRIDFSNTAEKQLKKLPPDMRERFNSLTTDLVYKDKIMLTEMQLHPAEEGQTVISLSVPSARAQKVARAIRGVLNLACHKIRNVNENGEEVRTIEEVFPDASQAMTLRGYRGKMEWTRQELVDKLGTTRNRISDMESGKRRISMNMSKRLGELFDVPHKVFL